MLDWKKTKNGTPNSNMHYAVSDGLRYEITGCDNLYFARVRRLNKTTTRVVGEQTANKPSKLKIWCQEYEDRRIAKRHKPPTRKRPPAHHKRAPSARPSRGGSVNAARIPNVG